MSINLSNESFVWYPQNNNNNKSYTNKKEMRIAMIINTMNKDRNEKLAKVASHNCFEKKKIYCHSKEPDD